MSLNSTWTMKAQNITKNFFFFFDPVLLGFEG